MRISDWSSDVCSSDLRRDHAGWPVWSGAGAARARAAPGPQGAVHLRLRRDGNRWRPVRRPAEQALSERGAGAQAARGAREEGWRAMTAQQLLMCDDEPAVGDFVRRIAEDLGYQMHFTAHAEGFSLLYRKVRPYVVILDLRSEEHTSELQSLM